MPRERSFCYSFGYIRDVDILKERVLNDRTIPGGKEGASIIATWLGDKGLQGFPSGVEHTAQESIVVCLSACYSGHDE